MQYQTPPTYEGQILQQHPDVREKIVSSSEFKEWKQNLTFLEIDEEVLYVRGGDMLKDEDQIVFEWVMKCHPEWLPENNNQ
jgi:hypothetical protein